VLPSTTSTSPIRDAVEQPSRPDHSDPLAAAVHSSVRQHMSLVLKRLLCLVVGHQPGDWSYISPGACNQAPLCERCRRPLASGKRTMHSWFTVYLAEGQCEQGTRCIRCGIEDESALRTAHLLGDYAPPDATSCSWMRRCSRCGWADALGPYHQWGHWARDESDSCTRVRTCSRCDQQESRIQHDWPLYTAICSRCGTRRLAGRSTCQQCGRPAIPGDTVCYSCL